MIVLRTLIALLAGGALTTFAAERELAAGRLASDERLSLDGRLDEPAWQRAPVASEFRQLEPQEGELSAFVTEVRVLFDADTLYVGATMRDHDVAGILSRQRARDADLGTDDAFSFILDTFADGRTGYLFETNPAGLLGDALLSDGPNESWDGVWDVRTTRTADGWYAEFAVPFRTLNFDPTREAWAVNFERVVRRANERSLWTGHRRNQGLFETIYAGKLAGLSGLTQGRGLEFKPYAVARAQRFSGRPAEDEIDGGFDLTYSISPNLRAALTVNTDFADTEVDDRTLNLGRFPISFPEKRDFFLEGSAVYDFPGDERVTPFYSRRIGLTRDGPVPVEWGGRLAGQIGRFDLGWLQMHTDAAFGNPGEDFTVFRTRANTGADSYAGLLFTRRSGGASGERYTVAADTRLRVFDWGDGQRYTFTPYAIWTNRAPGDTTSGFSDRSIFGMQNSVQYGGTSMSASYHRTGENYDPAVGFAFDTGYTEIDLQVGVEYEAPSRGFQLVEHELSFERRDTLGGELIDTSAELMLAELEFHSGDSLELGLEWEAEQLDEAFEIWDGINVPLGRYDGFGALIELRTAEKRSWAVDLGLGRRQFFDGYRNSIELGLEWRPLPGLEVAMSAEQEDISLPGGDFSTRLWSGRMHYSFTTRHEVSLLAQYDNDSDSIGLQARLRWIVRPGSEIFLGYLHDWEERIDGGTGRTRWATLGRESVAKGSYTWWF